MVEIITAQGSKHQSLQGYLIFEDWQQPCVVFPVQQDIKKKKLC
jgi:hypothetical protein